mmetsp:Transcript_102868/g.199346  ORF Transcript_102868/g.199346 Transcript_102868/m.199346 type:complete len:122 (+) Transcript_102868:102-467(+)
MANRSWKHTFKAHRIAANMGNASDNFVYHREMDSFPGPMQRPTPALKRKFDSPLSKMGRQMHRARNYVLPGGTRGSAGIYLGATLPLAGCLVLYTFITASSNDQKQTLKMVNANMGDSVKI